MRLVGFKPRDENAQWGYPEGGYRPLGMLRHDLVIDVMAVWSQSQIAASKERIRELRTQGNHSYGASFSVSERDALERILDTVRDQDDKELLSNTAASGHRFAWNFDEIVVSIPQYYARTLRDFYAFEEHVKTANANRGREVPEEWYEFPVFYFSNVSAIFGPDDVIPYPSYSDALDYELEVACVIGKSGINIKADEAEDYIFGYTIFNDWSARDVQRKEMKVGLGPAKGKDFAKSFGPYIVTPDELADRHTGRPGVYDLEMVARVNGVERSRGNWKDLYWSFGQMIERASQDVWLQPGDVIGSGTVGTGCLLELTKGDGPWLQPGDVVELEIERLGVLRNVVGEKRKDI